MEYRRLNGVQGLRAVAYIIIFMRHTKLGNYGGFGVWRGSIFHVISGFVMTNENESSEIMRK